MPKVEDGTETLIIKKPIQETHQKLISYMIATQGKVTVNTPDHLVVQYGNGFKFRMFGALFGSMDDYPRSVSIKLSEEAGDTKAEILVRNEMKFGSVRGIRQEIKHLFFKDINKLRMLLG